MLEGALFGDGGGFKISMVVHEGPPKRPYHHNSIRSFRWIYEITLKEIESGGGKDRSTKIVKSSSRQIQSK